jgi:hypothetical protein
LAGISGSYTEDENQGAKNRACDLVPLKGIHLGLAPLGRQGRRIRGDITRPSFQIIAAKRRIKSSLLLALAGNRA